MSDGCSRRQLLKQLLAGAGTVLLRPERAPAQTSDVAGPADREVRITSISPHTLRLSILRLTKDGPAKAPADGSLIKTSFGPPVAILRGRWRERTLKAGNLRVRASSDPLSFHIANAKGEVLQRLSVERETGVVRFDTGTSPLFGLGEGGPQFDRRGSVDRMVSGQGGYELRTHGGRVPIPWIIGTSGWAMFFHQPFGTFDLSGEQSRFQPAGADQALDLFFIGSPDPAAIMAEYARLTGHAEMPPLWSLGYQQSHRTLSSRQEILDEAKTFRQKKLPCDALIYLGTGFCPSGWNTENGAFDWNARVFPDPAQMLAELHQNHFHAVLHVVILSDRLRGTVHDP
ncbi:MAG TPA: TIM-barrel domain-containing protein, partial [Terriglobales bacterium]|nr:TIM-barrel domain-containing protein [Terriglobales bacterium]